MLRLPLLALLLTIAVTGCTGLDEAARRDLDNAALALDEQLDAPGLLATTALLYHAANTTYPTTPFELLGSQVARETGLQNLGLSDLALVPDGDGLRLSYTLLPTAADPSERFGTVTVTETDTVGVYTVGLLLERVADPDLSDRSLPLTESGIYNVVRAQGTLCAEVEAVRERMEAGAPVGDPPLGSEEAYTVTFTARDGAAAPAALRDGVTVTLPR